MCAETLFTRNTLAVGSRDEDNKEPIAGVIMSLGVNNKHYIKVSCQVWKIFTQSQVMKNAALGMMSVGSLGQTLET